eukprot:scaffold33819_cov40-Prasinocladus_malaysianus.AAC.1
MPRGLLDEELKLEFVHARCALYHTTFFLFSVHRQTMNLEEETPTRDIVRCFKWVINCDLQAVYLYH